MKSEFALSLSFDGITVLTRGAGGWYRLGSVSPDAEDMAAQLAELRSQAIALSDKPLHSKLVLPDTQIRYLSIETGDLPHDARISAACDALEGATPYPVSELAFDISADGATTHVAAVALETLQEAESFASEHGFGPASFVAAPGDMPFLGEPFFGTAKAARKLKVEPDGIAVVEVPAPIPEETSATNTAETEEPSLYPEDAADDELTPRSGIPIILPAAPPPAEPPKTTGAETAELITSHALSDDTSITEDTDTLDVDTDEAGPAIGFTTRRSRDQAPELSATPAEVSQKPAPTVILPETTKALDTPHSKAPVLTGPKAATSVAAISTVPAAPNLALPTPVLAHTTSAPPKPEAPAKAQPIASPSGDLTTPQARPLRSRSGRIGLMAAGLAAVSAIGAWAVVQQLPDLWSDLKRADLVETEDPVAPPVLATSASNTDLNKELTTTISTDGTAPTAADEAQTVSSEELTVTDAAVLEALGTPVVDEVAPIDGQDLIIASLPSPRDISTGAAGQAQTATTDDDAIFEDSEEIDPEALADGMVPEDETAGFAVDAGTDLEQAAQYAATGIWQKVPEISDVPSVISLDNVYVASIDNTDLSQDAIALPAHTAIDTDTPFGAVSSPTEAGRQFDLDERGLVTATPDGTLNPDGIMVYAGRPVKIPPATPDRPTARELEAADEAARIARLQQVRPRTRPNDLVEQTERAQLGGVVRAELLSKRPRLRPESLKTEEQESQPATALAVAAAPQPRARPANFANLVDRAQRRQEQTQTAAVAAAPAAVTPAIPSSASVARQATTQRALNLRRLNLIGVYGKPSDRRALVRLPSGRYVKVKVGDRLDGGRIVAIGDGQLQYQKGSRNTVLNLPNG